MSEKMPGPWREADWSWSIRRISSSFLFILAGWMFWIGGTLDHKYAFYAGVAALISGLSLLFCTTVADLVSVIAAARGAEAEQKRGEV
jgi:uncharacterized membrane protein YphA (DoxX/SURF4 family)